MSGIRKARRIAGSTAMLRKSAKVSKAAVFLILGMGMAIYGGFEGGHAYQIYRIGQSSQVLRMRSGVFYLPEVEAGDPAYRAAAYTGFASAAIGIVVSVLSLTVILDKRRTQRLAENIPTDASIRSDDS